MPQARRLLLISIIMHWYTLQTAAFVVVKSSRTCCRRHMSVSIDLITSTKSTTVKRIQALLKKRKKRVELNQSVIEGPRMVFDLLDNPNTRHLIDHVVVSEDRPEWRERLLEYDDDDDDDDLLICTGTPEVLAAMSDTATPQGLVATISIPAEASKTDAPSASSPPLYLLLDGVSDPGNMGTILRSSVAVGVAAVLLLPQCCDVWNPKAVRSAMGTTFQVPLLTVKSLEEARQVMTNWNIEERIYAATMEASGDDESIPYYNVDWNDQQGGGSVLVIGSEGNGLSQTVRHAVAHGSIRTVHVPMEAGIESLNAAVCSSVIMFDYQRQRLTGGSAEN